MEKLVAFVGALWEDLLGLCLPLPPGCPLCGGPSQARSPCAECLGRLAEYRSRPHCLRCGRRWSGNAGKADALCSDCRREAPAFLAARSLGPYEGILRRAVHRLKYGRRAFLGEVLGRLLADLVREDPALCRAQAVVPVPLYAARRHLRGFNQAEVLARATAGPLSLPVHCNVLRKIRGTPPQTGLSRRMRRENLRGAFAVCDPAVLRGRRVLLVDDVLTTGATAAECSRELLSAGAGAVLVVTVAGAEVAG
ncbi:MAG: ComF family protein [Firmicutes bacterium]|nr:ComF family protein [Bacillota bacterium]